MKKTEILLKSAKEDINKCKRQAMFLDRKTSITTNRSTHTELMHTFNMFPKLSR